MTCCTLHSLYFLGRMRQSRVDWLLLRWSHVPAVKVMGRASDFQPDIHLCPSSAPLVNALALSDDITGHGCKLQLNQICVPRDGSRFDHCLLKRVVMAH